MDFQASDKAKELAAQTREAMQFTDNEDRKKQLLAHATFMESGAWDAVNNWLFSEDERDYDPAITSMVGIEAMMLTILYYIIKRMEPEEAAVTDLRAMIEETVSQMMDNMFTLDTVKMFQ